MLRAAYPLIRAQVAREITVALREKREPSTALGSRNVDVAEWIERTYG